MSTASWQGVHNTSVKEMIDSGVSLIGLPMRSSMLVWLLFIASLQAICAGGSSCPDHRIRSSSSSSSTSSSITSSSSSTSSTSSSSSVPVVDARLFNKRRFRSPRVLFSAHPPDSAPPGVGGVRRAGAGAGRPARSPGGRTRRVAAASACGVVNKTRATDISGHEVTVLPNVNVNNVNKKQYFFETSCLGSGGRGRGGGGGGGGGAGGEGAGVSSCLGIDARHWNSYCTNSHTFVRALTTYRSLVAWRHIRINVACECVSASRGRRTRDVDDDDDDDDDDDAASTRVRHLKANLKLN
ncbi:LOW QUALITY PROTEIN: hypothetical protein CRUP_018091 [Coryphaenoides rupestris]|nr:LOW QUALITY PROTEIN: hypothetical protein CRUP_018091 [Coryphaenoides rupestris]